MRNRIIIICIFLYGALAWTTYANHAKPSSLVSAVKLYLQAARENRPPIEQQGFYKEKLTKEEADSIAALLWEDHIDSIKVVHENAWNSRVFEHNSFSMKFYFTVRGAKPPNGRSLYISMHGGGNTSSSVNDQQWENQKNLYGAIPREGLYLSPRAPTDTWNLWHLDHIDPLFEKIIISAIAFNEVDPNRVFIMGYSAGGDGTYQLAPRMSDRWAGAAMSAGHPNETSPLGLRNTAFALQVGGDDNAYDRNKIAAQWGVTLDSLENLDPDGYKHFVKVFPGKPHWMSLADTLGINWMSGFTRDPNPEKIVWVQDDVLHSRFYWLGVPDSQKKPRTKITAQRAGQRFDIEETGVDTVVILLNDNIADLDKPLTLSWKGNSLGQTAVDRTTANINESIQAKSDPDYIYSAKVAVHKDFVSPIVHNKSNRRFNNYFTASVISNKLTIRELSQSGIYRISVLSLNGKTIVDLSKYLKECSINSISLQTRLPGGSYVVRVSKTGMDVMRLVFVTP